MRQHQILIECFAGLRLFFPRLALGLAQQFSVGEKSGEYDGR